MGILYIVTEHGLTAEPHPEDKPELWYKNASGFTQIGLHGSPMLIFRDDGKYLCLKIPERDDGMLRNGDWPDDYLRFKSMKDFWEEVGGTAPQA